MIRDAETGDTIEGRVHVLNSSGRFVQPQGALVKVGPGTPFFYCHGEFEVDLPCGQVDILVERGTEYRPLGVQVDAASSGHREVDLPLERWTDLGSLGWHSGNTHIHYNQNETRPDERLHLDPRVEDLRVTVISILERENLQYASNKYPVGALDEFSSPHHHVECGEESRHNKKPWEIGYGHIMLINMKERVEPLSRGVLVSPEAPDYPPLCYACDDAHTQGALVLWCHNGNGMEAPVAAALGKLDAFNLFDPGWMDPEYDIWYHMLNCGIRLPASTGSDWFLCSANRVYADCGGAFSYGRWLDALRHGRTFVSNGPALFLEAFGDGGGSGLHSDGGASPGETIALSQNTLCVRVRWLSHYPLNTVEIVLNGRVVRRKSFGRGSNEGVWEVEVPVKCDGWIATRCTGRSRDSFGQAIFAHSSPIYIEAGRPSTARNASVAVLRRGIDTGLEWIDTVGRYEKRSHQRELFKLAREYYQ